MLGEAPGGDEVTEGKGFVGAAGFLLWKASNQLGLPRSQCHVTNVAKCVTKHPGAFVYCWNYFTKPEIDQLPPDTPIVALGSIAKDAILPEWTRIAITTARGCKKGRVVPALHPAFIRRTARASANSEKQDLQPTLTYDISAALKRWPLPPMTVSKLVPQGSYLSCDLETANKLNPRHGPIDQIGWANAKGEVYREKFTEDHRALYQAALDSAIPVFHNADFDIEWLEHHGFKRIEQFEDTMLRAHLLHPDLPLGLDFINSIYVHAEPWWGKTKISDDNYHAMDLYSTAQAEERMRLEITAEGLQSLYQDEVKPITRLCIDMKHKGMKVDLERMAKMQIAFGMQIEKIDAALSKLAPGILWTSSKQVIEYLYDTLGLPPRFKDGTGTRTADAEALEDLLEETGNPIVKLLLIRRQFDKMLSTYTDHDVDEHDFFHFNMSFTTSTGRARGFLLTLPRGIMRSLFIPDEPDWEFTVLDWEQVELWISAVCSGDKAFQQVLSNTKLHSYVGTRVLGHPVSKAATPDEYESMKHITHGYNFGRSDQAIASGHDIMLDLVKQTLRWMDSSFPVWVRYRQNQLSTARSQGVLTNPFGFKRWFWSGNTKGMAFSFDPQSCVANMVKRCVIQLWPQLPKPARIVFPFHDAIVLCHPKPMREQVTKIAKDCMEQAWPQLGGWRATVEVGHGDNLQEATH